MKRSLRRCLIGFVTLILALTAIPALAYSDGSTDGNDSRSPLDLARVRRTDPDERMRFEIWTHGAFRAARLNPEKGRFLMIGFDKNRVGRDPNPYEVCLFVFFDGRLRWLASDCSDRFLAVGLATKPTARKVMFTASMIQLDLWPVSHEWAAFSFWRGDPCAARCADSIPNRLPLFLRDLTPPRIVFSPPVLSSTISTSVHFPVPFTVTDPRGSGIASWTLFTGLAGTTPFTSGTTGGKKAPLYPGEEGGIYDFGVGAEDAQGNRAETDVTKRMLVPWDDDNVPDRMAVGAVTNTTDATAFGGGLTVLEDTTASITFTGGHYFGSTVWLIGSGTGTWTIEIRRNGEFVRSVDAASIPDGPRKLLWRGLGSLDQFTVTLTAGAGAAIDAVAMGNV